MPRYRYQPTPTTPPAPTVVTRSGSTTSASAGTKYVWLQYRNRQGYSLVSPVASVAIATGQGITVTIPSTARPTPDGTYIWEFVILMNTTNNAATASVVAVYPGYQSNQTTKNTLPYSIEFTADSHFEVNAIVANQAALPGDALHGARRYVTADDTVFERDTIASAWVESKPALLGTYVSSITAENGAGRDINAIDDLSIIIYPDYSMTAGSSSIPVGYVLENTESTAIASGTRIGLSVLIGEEDVSTTSGIVGGLKLKFLGYVNTTTGVLDTSGAGGSGTMSGVGSLIDYQGPETGLVLPKDLPQGWGYLLEVSAQITPAMLNNRVPQSATLKFRPYFYVDKATFNPIAPLSGSFIAALQRRRRIVPGSGLTAIALEGTGAIKLANGTGYSFYNVSRQEVPGLIANTADQNCVITINGTCLISDVIPDAGELRAIIGTVNGVGQATAWSSPVTLGPATAPRVTVTYPTNIRANYPDAAIANASEGTFNATWIRVFVQPNGGGTIRYWDYLVTPGAANGVFDVGTVAGTTVGSLPTRPNSYYGLYEPADNSFSTATRSDSTVFTAGSYQIAIAYVYSNAITSINHDSVAEDCIPEAGGTIIDSLEALKSWGPSVADLDAMRSLDVGSVFAGQTRFVQSVGKPYRYSATSTATDPGGSSARVVKLDDVGSGDPGRFIVDDLAGMPGAGLRYAYNSTITTPPASGTVRLNSASFSSVTAIYVHETDRNSIGVASILDAIANNTILQVSPEVGSSIYAYYRVTAISDAGAYRTYTVTHLGSVGSLTNGQDVTVALVGGGGSGGTAIQGVADLTALAALPEASSGVGAIAFVNSPGQGLPPTLYRAVASGTYTAFSGIVLTGSNSSAQWVRTSNLIFRSDQKPSAAPPFAGILWVADVTTTPARRIWYLSKGSSSASDWVPQSTVVFQGVDPVSATFYPDYVGQQFWYSGSLYTAIAADQWGRTAFTETLTISGGGGGW